MAPATADMLDTEEGAQVQRGAATPASGAVSSAGVQGWGAGCVAVSCESACTCEGEADLSGAGKGHNGQEHQRGWGGSGVGGILHGVS